MEGEEKRNPSMRKRVLGMSFEGGREGGRGREDDGVGGIWRESEVRDL